MAISDSEVQWLDEFFERCESPDLKPLSDWERDFVADQKKRYDEYGAEIRMSAKQYNVLFRIAENKTGQALPPGKRVE